MKTKKDIKPYTVPASIQKVFIAAVVGAFLVQLAFQLNLIFAQLPDNGNFSGFYWFLGTATLLPVIFFVIAYCLRPGKLSRISGLFEALVLSTAGTLLFSVLEQAITQYRIHVTSDYNSAWSLYGIHLLTAVLALSIYGGFLLYIKRKKLW